MIGFIVDSYIEGDRDSETFAFLSSCGEVIGVGHCGPDGKAVIPKSKCDRYIVCYPRTFERFTGMRALYENDWPEGELYSSRTWRVGGGEFEILIVGPKEISELVQITSFRLCTYGMDAQPGHDPTLLPTIDLPYFHPRSQPLPARDSKRFWESTWGKMTLKGR